MHRAVSSLFLLLLLNSTSFAQTAAYWRFEAFDGTTAVDASPAGLDGVHNGLGSIGSEVAIPVIPLLELTNAGAFRTNWQNSTTAGVIQVLDPNERLRLGGGSFTIEAWVKLSQNATTSGTNQRQHLCLKKRLGASDAELDYAVLVQAGDAGQTGRELAFRFGDGTNISTVVSGLSIDDLDWHHVSVGYDASSRILRFGLDGEYDVVSTVKPNYPNYLESGPLEIGGRRNASNGYNQFLRGRIDELRISNGFLAEDRLLSAPSRDCDANGVPDDTDLSTNPGLDCDANGNLDSCDIAARPEIDCNENGVIDLCQVDPFRYVLDDGVYEAQVNSDGTHTAWMNRHIVQAGQETITGIEIALPGDMVAEFTDLFIWSDPDGDGDPSDAEVIAEIQDVFIVSEEVGLLIYHEFFEGPLEIGPAGTSFFVGAVAEPPSKFPALIDLDGPHTFGASWIVGRNGPINPDDLTEEAVEFNLIELFFAGNWMIRAVNAADVIEIVDCNGNGVDDTCDIESGDSTDTDGNGVPDACEIVGIYTVPGDFDTIVTAARTVPAGSEIVVGDGIWSGGIELPGRDLVIRSENGPAQTIIDIDFQGLGFSLPGGLTSATVIEGFTVRNASSVGFFINDSSPVIRNCVVENAVSGSDGTAFFIIGNSSAVIDSCIVRNNDGSVGGGAAIAVSTQSPAMTTIRNCEILNNQSDFAGGGILALSAPVTVENCLVQGNISSYGLGAGITLYDDYDDDTGSVIRNNVIAENSFPNGEGEGAGIYCGFTENSLIEGNLIVGNVGKDGGGVYVRIGGTLVNNTIVDNSVGSQGRGGGVFVEVTGIDPVSIVNCIVWGNDADGLANQIELTDSGVAEVSYSCVEGGYAGDANIDADPQFVSRQTGDYGLSEGSPCIDAGDDLASTPGILDLDGETRIAGDAIDLGCYEYQSAAGTCEGDFNGDGLINGADFGSMLASWGECAGCPEDLDGNGFVTGADLGDLLGRWGLCP